jgi:uncharacterized membrane protein
MKELRKNEKIVFLISAILLFAGKILCYIGYFVSNQILVEISIFLNSIFYIIWILVTIKVSKVSASFLSICALVEVLVTMLLIGNL